jgi:hypothetical protein
MTIESDEQAIRRALGNYGQFGEMAPSENPIDNGMLIETFPTERDVFHIFFIYMRFNSNGAFIAEQFFHKGISGNPIIPDTNFNTPGSLGWYTKDMASYGRLEMPKRDGRYQHWNYGLSDMKFPSHYSYVVLYMDDVYWPYLEDHAGRPVVPFHDEKDSIKYDRHGYAFTKASKFKIPMTNVDDVTTYREAVVMINRMRDKNNDELSPNNRESYCFDLRMRVRYAGSTDGVTIIIDPTGENLGPPILP